MSKEQSIISNMNPNQPTLSPEVQLNPKTLNYPGGGPTSSNERFNLLSLGDQGPGKRTPLAESSKS